MRSALAIFVCCGCSWVTVTTPEPARPQECTTSQVAPTIDTIVAVPAMLLALFADSEGLRAIGCKDELGETDCEQRRSVGVFIGIPITALAVVATASALYGYDRTGRCRRLSH